MLPLSSPSSAKPGGGASAAAAAASAAGSGPAPSPQGAGEGQSTSLHVEPRATAKAVMLAVLGTDNGSAGIGKDEGDREDLVLLGGDVRTMGVQR